MRILCVQVVLLRPISLGMNLIVDVGNSLIKVAVFQDSQLIHKETIIKSEFKTALEIIKNDFTISKIALSKVADLPENYRLKLEKIATIFEISHTIKLPFKNLYTTPQTLGLDRIALAAAATKLYAYKNVLVIDAGTCITYDFINKSNEYLGGAISPGVYMRYKAMNTFTGKLPLLDPNLPKSFIGNSTATSMHSGVVYGTCAEIDGTITRYKQQYEDLTVILTGGDAQFLRENIKNGIFANSNFLLVGLNYLLEFNTDK